MCNLISISFQNLTDDGSIRGHFFFYVELTKLLCSHELLYGVRVFPHFVVRTTLENP